MGISESALTTTTKPLSDLVNNVLGSLDCVCKSKCCDYYKWCHCYSHCRTNENGEVIDNSDDEVATIYTENQSPASPLQVSDLSPLSIDTP